VEGAKEAGPALAVVASDPRGISAEIASEVGLGPMGTAVVLACAGGTIFRGIDGFSAKREEGARDVLRRLAAELGGRVRAHRRFGTAKWLLSARVWRDVGAEPAEGLPASIDLVTARTEFYTHPTALPEVASSSIKQDLHRRDFTINTLAIRLDPDHWGELLDFYGGMADLQNGIVRVLHSLSFVDDPTRMLRAARFESRLGFRMDPRTEELVRDALPLLRRVSGNRIAHELTLIFEEPEPERALCRLQELGILSHIHPALRCNAWLCARFRALREELDAEVWEIGAEDRAFLCWALLTYRLQPDDIEALAARLRLARSVADDLQLLPVLREATHRLARLSRPSTIVRLLEPFPGRVLAAAWLASGSARTRQRLLEVQRHWRKVQPELGGDDLKALGLRPGPLFGRLLDALRDARLDGKVSSRADELQLVERLLASG